ncbi:MAG: FAD-dependent monooxygenase [Micrococcaceae bacterium]|uniref:FAD-dependent oxidoreductase n=1 Tax=Arthrobacter sp. 179 TaxID=3457734 RepID=UPI002653CA25|nr:FAD-dependent monooxygenase [Micrococcaceae bacterium]
MVEDTPLTGQLEAAARDRLRVLVVGAGVAGVCVAGLLRRRGLHPVVLERSPRGADEGYMLGLMPLVEAPLRRLGARDRYLRQSVAMHRYQLRSSRGRVIRTYSFDGVFARYGRYGGIGRGELIEAMAGPGLPATLGASVAALVQDAAGATARIQTPDGPVVARFDLVIAADGMNSTTRALVVDPADVERFDTGWGGWVAWSDAGTDTTSNDLYAETWGRGFFIGRYPVRHRVGVFVGGPRGRTDAGPAAFVDHLRTRIAELDRPTADALVAIESADSPFLWKLADARSPRWALGRVILLGDAAAGFLPTAGVGAAMAIESAAVLDTHLAGVPATGVARALLDYEQAQRPRVLAAHENSRRLAKLMFATGRAFCSLRDLAARFMTVSTALGPIISLHRSAPLTSSLRPRR